MAYPFFHGTDGAEPDPYGQAAILLVESLIHGLLARGIIAVADALEVVDTASEVVAEISFELGGTSAALEMSRSVLETIRASLAGDIQSQD